MEVTVRGTPGHLEGEPKQRFGAAVTFLQPGPRALERVQLSAKSATYSGVMQLLIQGFKVTPGAHDKDSAEFRVLTALCHATGVVDLDA
jgi:hypothetical protein